MLCGWDIGENVLFYFTFFGEDLTSICVLYFVVFFIITKSEKRKRKSEGLLIYKEEWKRSNEKFRFHNKLKIVFREGENVKTKKSLVGETKLSFKSNFVPQMKSLTIFFGSKIFVQFKLNAFLVQSAPHGSFCTFAWIAKDSRNVTGYDVFAHEVKRQHTPSCVTMSTVHVWEDRKLAYGLL